MSSLDFYLDHDHLAKKRTMIRAVLAGIAAGAIAEFFELSPTWAVALCVVTTGCVELMSAFLYSEPNRKVQRALSIVPIRRHILRAAYATGGLIVLSILRIPRMLASSFDNKLRAVSDVHNSENVQEVQRIAIRAKAAQIELDQTTLRSVAHRFLAAADKTPDSWRAITALLEYKSFLNIRNIPSEKKFLFRRAPYLTYYDVPDSAGDMVDMGLSKPPDVPIFRRLGRADQNAFLEAGPAYLFVTGGVMPLDGHYLKRVVFIGVHVIYDSEAIVLENVLFANCTFEMGDTPNAVDFARAVFDDAKALRLGVLVFHNP